MDFGAVSDPRGTDADALDRARVLASADRLVALNERFGFTMPTRLLRPPPPSLFGPR
jgi:hypothetical protein